MVIKLVLARNTYREHSISLVGAVEITFNPPHCKSPEPTFLRNLEITKPRREAAEIFFETTKTRHEAAEIF